MSKQKYTEEELEIIQKWAIPSDYEIERAGHFYGGTNIKVSVLEQSKRRKESVERVNRQAMKETCR